MLFDCIILLCVCVHRYLKREWNWNANATGCLVPVQPRPVGLPSQNSERLAIFWKRNTTLLCRWKLSGQAGFDNPPFWRSNRSEVTRNPWKRIWYISTSHPTTARKMLPLGVWARRDVSAIVPHPALMGATWCAVGGATTPTSTPKFGSVTANSTGAALWNATRAVSGQRCSPVNNSKCDHWEKDIAATCEES